MKNLYLILMTAFLPCYLVAGIFSSEEDDCWEDVPVRDVSSVCSNTFNFDFNGSMISSAKFSSPFDVRSEKLSYSGIEGTLSYSFFLNPDDAVTVGVGYEGDRVDWEENPFFDQTNFKRYHFNLDALTYRLPCWIWRAGVSVSCDGDHWNLSDYALYRYHVWGRYSFPLEILPDFGLHLGLLGRVGIEKEWQQPIFGVDFCYERWMVHLIYPVDLSIAYEWADYFYVDVAYRWWNKRYRVDKDADLSKGIFEYRNNGLEIGASYRYQEVLYAGFHLGRTFNVGEIVIHDKNDVNEGHYRLKSSFYLGGELAISY